MTAFAKILLNVIVTVILAPTNISLAQAIAITNGSYEFESLDSGPGGVGLKNFGARLIGLGGGPASAAKSELLGQCDLDPQSCVAISETLNPNDAGISTTRNTMTSKARTAGGATEFSAPTAILLLIVGLLGLSRLRGKPVE